MHTSMACAWHGIFTALSTSWLRRLRRRCRRDFVSSFVGAFVAASLVASVPAASLGLQQCECVDGLKACSVMAFSSNAGRQAVYSCRRRCASCVCVLCRTVVLACADRGGGVW